MVLLVLVVLFKVSPMTAVVPLPELGETPDTLARDHEKEAVALPRLLVRLIFVTMPEQMLVDPEKLRTGLGLMSKLAGVLVLQITLFSDTTQR